MKLIMMFFVVVILSLLFTYFKQNKRFFFQDNILILIIYFLLPGSRSTFPEVDPDPDPAKGYGSGSEILQKSISHCCTDQLRPLKKVLERPIVESRAGELEPVGAG